MFSVNPFALIPSHVTCGVGILYILGMPRNPSCSQVLILRYAICSTCLLCALAVARNPATAECRWAKPLFRWLGLFQVLSILVAPGHQCRPWGGQDTLWRWLHIKWDPKYRLLSSFQEELYSPAIYASWNVDVPDGLLHTTLKLSAIDQWILFLQVL